MTRLAWLAKPAVQASANAIKTEIEKLTFLRGIDTHVLDLSMLPAERRRFLAQIGRRSAKTRRWGAAPSDLADSAGAVRGRHSR